MENLDSLSMPHRAMSTPSLALTETHHQISISLEQESKI